MSSRKIITSTSCVSILLALTAKLRLLEIVSLQLLCSKRQLLLAQTFKTLVERQNCQRLEMEPILMSKEIKMKRSSHAQITKFCPALKLRCRCSIKATIFQLLLRTNGSRLRAMVTAPRQTIKASSRASILEARFAIWVATLFGVAQPPTQPQ